MRSPDVFGADAEIDMADPTTTTGRRLVRGSALVLAAKVVTVVATIVSNALVARLLAPAEVGSYFLLVSVVYFLATLGQAGMRQTVVRVIAEDLANGGRGRIRPTVDRAFAVAAATATALGLLLVLLGPRVMGGLFDAPVRRNLVDVAAVWVVALSVQVVLAESFRGLHDLRLATLFEGQGLGSSVVAAAALLAVWVFTRSASLGQVLVLMAVSAVIVAVGAGATLARRLRSSRFARTGQVPTGELLSIAGPLLIINVVWFFTSSGPDVWIVGAFRGQADVAGYGAAVRLVTLVATPLLIVSAVLPPLVAHLHARGQRRELEDVLRAAAGIAALPALAVLAAFLVFGRPILGAIFGSFYRRGSGILAILSVGQAINVVAGACGLALIMTGHQRTMMSIAIVSAIVSVGGGLILVQPFGAPGVAAATAAGAAFQNVATMLSAKRRLGVWTYARLAPSKMVELLREAVR